MRPDLTPLAATAAEVAREWGVALGGPFPLARYSFVAPAGDDAVIKVTPASDDESDEEADALMLWAGDGAVPLLRHDRERRVLLLGRARPGGDLASIDDEEATTIAVEVAQALAAGRSAVPVDRRPRATLARSTAGRAWAPPGPRLPGGSTTSSTSDRRRSCTATSTTTTCSLPAWIRRDRPQADARRARVRRRLVPVEPALVPMRLDVTERRLAVFAAAGLDEWRMRAWAVIRGAYLGADEGEVDVLRALL